jgi:hypothetical protein
MGCFSSKIDASNAADKNNQSNHFYRIPDKSERNIDKFHVTHKSFIVEKKKIEDEYQIGVTLGKGGVMV